MVYKITEYNLEGAKLVVSEPLPNVVSKEVNGIKRFYEPDGIECFKNRLWYYTDENPKGSISHTEKLLPYYADVTEDVPGNYSFEPRVYKNCQLMTEKHGGYLQFLHKPTNTVLRIAINSNTYKPI
jgi:hypothetical protein